MHRFQTDLRGLTELLSHHLYASPDVFVRELLQNAVDAHTARSLAGLGDESRIVIRALSDGELLFEDAGVGLSEEEVHGFLATIGQSSKRAAETPRPGDFLGQFGIGLLACFVVSDTIVVHTRSARDPEAPVLRWRGHEDGTYELDRVTEGAHAAMAPGTQVHLRARPERAELFAPDAVRSSVRRYGRLLPHPITLTTPAGDERLDAPAPWRDERLRGAARREALLSYGRDLYGQDFLDVLDLESDAGGVDGLAFVLPHATVTGARRADRVYLKGMLVSEKAERLLPDWAFFVKALVDVRSLRPLASREAFVEDGTLAAARTSLGACVQRYLRAMARDEPERLQKLLALHHQPIKQLAAEDPEFLEIVAPWLPFETSAGRMSLEDYLSRNGGAALVARSVDSFRQVAPLVAAQGACVINAGYVHDFEILERYAELREGLRIDEVDALRLTDSFEDLDLDDRRRVAELLAVADLVLQPHRCQAQVKRFEPAALPAVYAAGESAAFVRQAERSKEVSGGLWSNVLGELTREQAPLAKAQLTLNFASPLVQRLSRVDDPEVLRPLVEVLYVQTLLLGHHPLSASEMSLVGESLSALMELSLDRGSRMLQ